MYVGKGGENEGGKWEVRRKTKLVGQMALFHDKYFSATIRDFPKLLTPFVDSRVINLI